MKLSNQAVGAIMLALQRSLMEQTDIVPTLLEMNLQVSPDDQTQSTLIVTNPPVITFEKTTLNEGEEDV